MGFIEETGAARSYRDSRIIPINEGTNGIQGDVVTRKLSMDRRARVLYQLSAEDLAKLCKARAGA